MIVVDASVFIKLFHEENDSDAAHRMFDAFLDGGEQLLAPLLLRYEALGVALRYSVSFARIDTNRPCF